MSLQMMMARARKNHATPPITANYFDPAKKGPNILLANSNKMMQQSVSSTGWESAFGIDPAGSGYFEMHVDNILAGPNTFGVGVGNTSSPTGNYCGSDANGWAFISNGSVYHNGASIGAFTSAFAIGDVIGVVVDSGSLWFFLNGTSINGGDPSLGTSPIATGLGSTLYPIGTIANQAAFLTLRMLLSEFSYAPPSGIPAWN